MVIDLEYAWAEQVQLSENRYLARATLRVRRGTVGAERINV